jgi:hypothetical protein
MEGMTPMDHLGFISRERFDDLDTDAKLGVIFDFLTFQIVEQNRVKKEENDSRLVKCSDCIKDFDNRYEKKWSGWWKAGYLTLMAISGAVGGFFAVVLGYAGKAK